MPHRPATERHFHDGVAELAQAVNDSLPLAGVDENSVGPMLNDGRGHAVSKTHVVQAAKDDRGEAHKALPPENDTAVVTEASHVHTKHHRRPAVLVGLVRPPHGLTDEGQGDQHVIGGRGEIAHHFLPPGIL